MTYIVYYVGLIYNKEVLEKNKANHLWAATWILFFAMSVALMALIAANLTSLRYITQYIILLVILFGIDISILAIGIFKELRKVTLIIMSIVISVAVFFVLILLYNFLHPSVFVYGFSTTTFGNFAALGVMFSPVFIVFPWTILTKINAERFSIVLGAVLISLGIIFYTFHVNYINSSNVSSMFLFLVDPFPVSEFLFSHGFKDLTSKVVPLMIPIYFFLGGIDILDSLFGNVRGNFIGSIIGLFGSFPLSFLILYDFIFKYNLLYSLLFSLFIALTLGYFLDSFMSLTFSFIPNWRKDHQETLY